MPAFLWWIDVAVQLQGVGQGMIYGYPGAFGLILKEDAHRLCGGSGVCKEKTVPDSFPTFLLPPPFLKLHCLAHYVNPLSPYALAQALEEQAVRALLTQGAMVISHQHLGDPPDH
ncbi:hypothetical protein AV530_010971 [Patagioenas fasciata monilis]|uniref:Uncharacterized protein n=1 Tax=Patagioenas fasciata monilis TaxID=372326 RepID=A0A1V4K8G9_PATFA|nr:hypothetical protein AV530_010971 [Patagioenas fasciata monilis]